jgi:hypothetical protein
MFLSCGNHFNKYFSKLNSFLNMPEIWGYKNTKQLEKLHLQFCRNILGVRTTTPNFMTYGELGRTLCSSCDKTLFAWTLV